MFSNKDLRKLLVPLMIEQVLTALMGTVDTMMVSNVGAAAISGVSLVDSINILVIQLFSAVATGGTIICSQYLGHGDRERSDNAARQIMLASFVLSAAIMVFCLCLRGWLLHIIFGTVEQAVMDGAMIYFLITAFSYPFIAMFNAGSALYRSAGESKLPMKISVASNILNVIGNAILIFVFQLGIAGAAISTLLSRIVACVAVLIAQRRPGQIVTVGPLLRIRPDIRVIWLVLSVGIPTGIENAMFQFGKLVVQSTVSTLGTTAIAANAIVAVLELFTSMPSMGIGLGLVTVAGQCVGAGRLEDAKYYIKKLTIWSAAVLLVTNWAIFAITSPVTKIAGLDPDAAKMTIQTLLVISIVKPFLWPLAFTPCNGTRAAGDVRYNMIVSTISMWTLRVGLTTILCRFLGFGLIGIWCGYFADWFVRAICFTVRFCGKKWYSHHIIENNDV